MINYGTQSHYGTVETNGLGVPGSEYHDQFDADVSVKWNHPDLARITRFRILSDPGFPAWDVSYCHGVLKDGTKVHVDLPFSQMPKRGWRKFVVEEAKRDGVYAKGIGILDRDVVSSLC